MLEQGYDLSTEIKEDNRSTMLLMRNGRLSSGKRMKHLDIRYFYVKKDGTVRTISDFRELNKRIVRKPYPIPKISTTLQEMEGFSYATALDLNMGYYTIRSSREQHRCSHNL